MPFGRRGFHRFIILDAKLTMAEAGWSGSSSANRWLTLSVVLPCFLATNPKSLVGFKKDNNLRLVFVWYSSTTITIFLRFACNISISSQIMNVLHWAASFFAPSIEERKKNTMLFFMRDDHKVFFFRYWQTNGSGGVVLSVLGIDVAVGYRVDGIVSPEEKSAARERINTHTHTHTHTHQSYYRHSGLKHLPQCLLPDCNSGAPK